MAIDGEDGDDGDDGRVQQQQQQQEVVEDHVTSTTSHRAAKDNEAQDEKEIHIAPMLDYSKHEFRQLFRILSTKLVLWTDMIVDTAILKAAAAEAEGGGSAAARDEEGEHTSNKSLLDLFGMDNYHHTNSNNTNNKQIIQIGGNDPIMIGQAVSIILLKESKSNNTPYTDFTEINLNVDCPSCQVSDKGKFGAILMKDVQRLYDILSSMKKEAGLNSNNKHEQVDISIKCRIGVDEHDNIEFISNFIRILQPVCTRFIFHARKCVLNGLNKEGGAAPAFSARQNRTIPPLNYPRVYELCRKFPNCSFWINGGIHTLQHAKSIVHGGTTTTKAPSENTTMSTGTNDDCLHRHQVPCQLCNLPYGSCTAPPQSQPSPSSQADVPVVPANLCGVMMGRIAIDNPCIFADVDRYFFGLNTNPCQNRLEVIDKYCKYLETIYPRRCCEDDNDDDDDITFGIPAPNKDKLLSEYCSRCRGMYCRQTKDEDDEEGRDATTKVSSSGNENKDINCCSTTKSSPSRDKIKFASRVIGRSLKPIRYLFVGLPKSRKFLTTLDQYGQDLTLRNCGPGFIIRKAVQDTIPTNILLLPFPKTE